MIKSEPEKIPAVQCWRSNQRRYAFAFRFRCMNPTGTFGTRFGAKPYAFAAD